MISFDPLIPWPLIAAAVAAALALLVLGALRGSGNGAVGRALAVAALALALLNPRAVSEQRQAQPDIAVVVLDESDSQRVGERKKQSEQALASVRDSLSNFNDLETVVVRAGSQARDGGSRLFAALSKAMSGISARRLAGAILITDGQVHDLPSAPERGPLHVLLSGASGERDRRLIVDKAPVFGIAGKTVSVDYRIEDHGGDSAKTAAVSLAIDGKPTAAADAVIGQAGRFTFPLEHPGKTVVELRVEPSADELSTLNNRAALTVNGVRDRLRVLLVSGQPHPGERVWRNLLKSDPSVDLVHFTILRPPEKADFTPLKELSLIVFPIKELFDVKLKEFDLIVFDRYVMRDVLPPAYVINIRDYLRGGGAVLLASGPEFAGQRSLFRSELGEVMPAKPTGRVVEQGFAPRLTDAGRRHPVTAALLGDSNWGRWFRQVETETVGGDVLMRGPGESPLLVLNREGKGRIAQLMSDHIWLWARGFEGGGPHGELMRRLAHWLMKEPDLEEESLTARIKDGSLTVERRSLDAEPPEVTVTAPSGVTRTLQLEDSADGVAFVRTTADEIGLYRIGDGAKTTVATSGALNPLELADLRATGEMLAPLVKAGGGGVSWIVEGLPELRRTRPGRDTAGRGWIGLRRNDSYVVSGLKLTPLLPGSLVLALVLGGLAAAWMREGR